MELESNTLSIETSIFPVEACLIHLFDTLASGSLPSLKKQLDAGCTAYFNAKKVYILFQGNFFLQGVRSASTTPLWKLNKDHKQYKEDEEVKSLNDVVDNP